MTEPTIERTLDWRKSTDPRNALHPFTAAAPVPRRPRAWALGQQLDQGPDGACVGFGWTGELLASPVRAHVGDPDAYARALYHAAQHEDEWQGENYEGTSVNAGAIVARAWGHIAGWRWAQNVSGIIDALITEGPVVIGMPWLTAMFRPRPSGLLEDDGNVEGGHCVLLYGYHPRMRLAGEPSANRYEVFRMRNSWGAGWGHNGSAFLPVALVDHHFADIEAAVPMGRHVPPTPA